MRIKRHVVDGGAILAVVFFLAACASQCAKTPPTLSPKGAAAFHATRVVKALDVVRDTAIDANAQQPPLISEDTARKVVTWHRAAVLTIGASPQGWAPTVTTGLDQLLASLPPSDRAQLGPYLSAAKLLIVEVTR